MPAAAGSGIPSLSEILFWDTQHLYQAATDWTGTARHWEDTFTRVHRGTLSPGGTTWDGAAAEAAQERTFSDLVKVRGLADVLSDAATIARRGADQLDYLKRHAIEAIHEAQEQGFTVNEDLTVTDTSQHSGFRVAAAQQFATAIADRATVLSTADKDIAAKISAATTELSNSGFSESPSAPPREEDDPHDEVRPLGYQPDRVPPGQDLPPPPPVPPPLQPTPNDDPWAHGGDRRWSSIASAGIKQKLVATAILEMERNGETNAARMLKHYLENSGSTQALDPGLVDSWLADSTNAYGAADPASAPAALVRSNLNSITAQALDEARRTGQTVTLTGNTPWAVVAGSDGDAVRTLGHYSASTAYTVTMNPDGTYSMTYRNDLYDWYNFATTTPMPWDLAHNLSSAAHDLQAAGYAHDFLITGSGTSQTVQGRALP